MITFSTPQSSKPSTICFCYLIACKRLPVEMSFHVTLNSPGMGLVVILRWYATTSHLVFNKLFKFLSWFYLTLFCESSLPSFHVLPYVNQTMCPISPQKSLAALWRLVHYFDLKPQLSDIFEKSYDFVDYLAFLIIRVRVMFWCNFLLPKEK